MAISLPHLTTGFVVPVPLNLANSRMHWAKAHRQKRKYWDVMTLYKNCKAIPAAPLVPPELAIVRMKFFLWAKNDTDNLYNRAKWPLDWLVGWGYIAGDRDDQIRLEISQEVDRKFPRLRIEIEPVEAPA